MSNKFASKLRDQQNDNALTLVSPPSNFQKFKICFIQPAEKPRMKLLNFFTQQYFKINEIRFQKIHDIPANVGFQNPVLLPNTLLGSQSVILNTQAEKLSKVMFPKTIMSMENLGKSIVNRVNYYAMIQNDDRRKYMECTNCKKKTLTHLMGDQFRCNSCGTIVTGDIDTAVKMKLNHHDRRRQ